MEKILLSEKPNFGALDEFITLLDKLQNEFDLQTVAINSIDNDNRNMFAELRGGKIGTIKLEFDYYYSKFYLIPYNQVPELEKVKAVILDFIKY